jgi:ABC-type polysaccharide/polyol phosphate export permease
MGDTTGRHVLDLSGERTPVRRLLGDAVRQRDLLPMLARQDFRGRYRSASLGVLWSVFVPLLQGAVLAVVFTRIVRIPTDVPYPVFVIIGMVTWTYLRDSLQVASTSIVDNGGLAGKVYFPRLILPAVAALANGVAFVISLGVALALLPLFGVPLRASLFALPLAMLLAAALAFAAGANLAVAHVYARDTRYIVTATMLVAFYAAPVIYPLELAGPFRPVLLANPATGVLQLMRWCLLGEASGGLAAPLASTLAWTIGLLLLALAVYSRHERTAVDRL